MKEQYKWPPGSTLTFSRARSKPWKISRDRELDLSDTLMLYWNPYSRTVYMTVQLKKPTEKWPQWNEAVLTRIESMIREDLNFDAYHVRITRLTTTKNTPCTDAFRWKLNIHPMCAR